MAFKENTSKLNLTPDEKQVLNKHRKYSPQELVRTKVQTIILYDLGVKVEIIAEMAERSIDTIYDWIKAFKKTREAFVISGYTGNQNASKLTKEQKEQVAEVLKSPPSEHSLPKEFWDVPQLKNYVKTNFSVVYESRQSYHMLLKYGNLSFKYPSGQDPRKNQEFTDKRTAEIKQEVAELKKQGYVVYASDESRLEYQTEIRQAWLPKGKKTVVKTTRGKQYQNYLGFLNQSNGDLSLYPTERGNQYCTIKVLEELMQKHSGKKVCVVWDNAKCHHGKELRKKLGKGQSLENLHLINFAPYSPETNPIEHVWNWGKSQVSNRNSGDFDKLKQKFESELLSRSYEYWI